MIAPGTARKLRLVKAAGVIVAATGALVAALHLKQGRTVLQKLGGCPAGFAAADRGALDRARRASLTLASGDGSAKARPALGFQLDRTTDEDVRRWASTHGVGCTPISLAGRITCTDVEAALLGDPATVAPVEELTLAFDTSGRLVNVLALRHHASPADALAIFTARAKSLEEELGPPPHRATGAAGTSALEYRYVDYVGEVSATTLPEGSVLVREHFLSTS